MDIKSLIVFKNWADEIYLTYCEDLSDDQFRQTLSGYDRSINDILFHMYEVYYSWYQFLTTKDYSNIPEIEKMSKTDIITGIREYNDKMIQYIDAYDVSQTHSIQWSEEDKEVKTTAENVLFNYVTHSAYHRGQLAIYLRYLGQKTITETDFNPYIYEMGQT